MAFIDLLRVRHKGAEESANGIDMPTSRNFNPATWQAAYAATSDGHPLDRSAFEAGLFVDAQLAHLRHALKDLEGECKRETIAERSSALVGFLNMECSRSVAQTNAAAKRTRGPISLDQVLFGRLVPGAAGTPGYTSEEVTDLLTDCIRHPLRAAIACKGHGAKSDWLETMDSDRATEISVQLALHYDTYEKLWAHVKWLDAEFHAERGAVIFNETAGDLAAEEHLNRARRSYSFNRAALESLNGGLPLNHDIPMPKSVLVIGNSDPTQLQCVSYANASAIVQELTRAALLNWAMSSTISYEALRGMHHSLLRCNIDDLLNVWIQLAVVAFQCQRRLVHRFEDEGLDLASDPFAATTFNASDLKALIAQATGLEPDVVAIAIKRFTFGKGGIWTADLWDRPLVGADDKLVLAWPPLVTGNIGRLIPALVRDCKEVSEGFAKRGHEFEDQVVKALRVAASNSRHTAFREAIVLAARLDPEDERVGDVDCVLVIGSTAFCLECRSVKHAATAYEQWDIADDLLKKKARQAIRKRDHLSSNPLLLADIAASRRTPLRQEITRYVAVVVSNCFLFEGSRKHEPYFVHVNTLVNMLLGGPEFGTMEQGESVSLFVDRFVETPSAGDAMAKEIQSPAKAEYYHSLLQTNSFSLPRLEPSMVPVTVLQLTVNPATDATIGAVLQTCSFAPLLRRIV